MNVPQCEALGRNAQQYLSQIAVTLSDRVVTDAACDKALYVQYRRVQRNVLDRAHAVTIELRSGHRRGKDQDPLQSLTICTPAGPGIACHELVSLSFKPIQV